jgi:hypothetical protein
VTPATKTKPADAEPAPADLAARAAATECELAEADAALAVAALAAEQGAEGAATKLAAAERHRERLAAELHRLKLAAGELERQTSAAASAAGAAERAALVAVYCDARDRVDELNGIALGRIESLVEVLAEARAAGGVAAQAALRLGLADERGTIGPRLPYLRTALAGVATGSPHLCAEAHEGILRSWRATRAGRVALELQASLTTGDAAG